MFHWKPPLIEFSMLVFCLSVIVRPSDSIPARNQCQITITKWSKLTDGTVGCTQFLFREVVFDDISIILSTLSELIDQELKSLPFGMQETSEDGRTDGQPRPK